MKTLTGTFESITQAEDAVRALQDAGVASGDISLDDENGGGRTLVTARVDDAQLDAAAAILNQDGVVDVEERRADAEEGAPSNVDASDPRSYRREDEPDSSLIVPPLPR